MAARRLTYQEAARLIVDADPLTEVRITLAWVTTDGVKRPALRFSSRSVVNYKAKAKPLGTVCSGRDEEHWPMLHALAGQMFGEGRLRDQAGTK